MVLIGYMLCVHWWFVAPHLDMAAQMNDLREQQERFRATAQQRGQIEKKLVEVRAFEQGNQSFLMA